MAVFDRSSPLHGHFDWAKTFPAVWTKKHSSKGIGPLLLIHLGLASAKTGCVWKAGQFNVDWTVLTRDELSKFHKNILNMLSDRQFGPYQVAELLFGSAKACSVGLTSNTYTINPGTLLINCFIASHSRLVKQGSPQLHWESVQRQAVHQRMMQTTR
jgi:hypothetical protein